MLDATIYTDTCPIIHDLWICGGQCVLLPIGAGGHTVSFAECGVKTGRRGVTHKSRDLFYGALTLCQKLHRIVQTDLHQLLPETHTVNVLQNPAELSLR